jgi:hypothetical protein
VFLATVDEVDIWLDQDDFYEIPFLCVCEKGFDWFNEQDLTQPDHLVAANLKTTTWTPAIREFCHHVHQLYR